MSGRRQNANSSSAGDASSGGNARRAAAANTAERSSTPERQTRREHAQNLNRANSASPSIRSASTQSSGCSSQQGQREPGSSPRDSGSSLREAGSSGQANAASVPSNQAKSGVVAANSPAQPTPGGATARPITSERVAIPSKNNPSSGQRGNERGHEDLYMEGFRVVEPASNHAAAVDVQHPHHVMANDAKALDADGGESVQRPDPLPPPVLLPLPGPGGDNAPYNWQASKTTVNERLACMFNTEIMADVHFVVGRNENTRRIPAHKFVLSIGSAVFDAMFNGGMATTAAEVDLPDVEPSAFLALLRFLYSDEVQIGPETVMTTLYTAKKYAVPALERACVDFLKRNLSYDNAFMLLTQARLFDEPQLAALCLETIDKNTNEALAAEGFTDIDLETLCVVLERDTLGIRECKLFTAICRWSEAECGRQSMQANSENKRAVLGRAMQLVRFPLMTVEEFAVGAAQSGILTDREVVQLFLHFTVNPKPSVSFLATPRCCLTGKEQVVSRFGQIESRWGYSGTSDRIR